MYALKIHLHFIVNVYWIEMSILFANDFGSLVQQVTGLSCFCYIFHQRRSSNRVPQPWTLKVNTKGSYMGVIKISAAEYSNFKTCGCVSTKIEADKLISANFCSIPILGQRPICTSFLLLHNECGFLAEAFK